MAPLLRDPDLPNERWINCYRRASTEAGRAVIAEAIALVERKETELRLRRNKRTAFNNETFRQTVEAVVSDLAYNHLHEDDSGIYVTRSNKHLGKNSRYRPRVFSKAFPAILDTMRHSDTGLVLQEAGVWKPNGQGRATTLFCGPALARLIEDLDFDDFEEAPDAEPLVLKRSRDPDNYWDHGDYKEYADTEETAQLRAEIEAINERLATANLRFDAETERRLSVSIDTRNRRMRRIFTRESFASGGRLYGGFWQPLNSSMRLAGIRIDGEPVVELDYGQVGPRILYGMANAALPQGDLYAIKGFGNRRAGIKKVMNAMCFTERELTRIPKGTRELFPDGERLAEIVGAIEARHDAIKHLFSQGLGHQAQFVESSVLIKVLDILHGEGITALPVHDAILVPRSAAERAQETMLDVFQRITGVEAMVTVEGEGGEALLHVGQAPWMSQGNAEVTAGEEVVNAQVSS